MIDNTEYLYHYTNVNALAMILKTRQIKFTPLTKLDDLEEEKIKDTRLFTKYVYVSSWTDDETESIPMWKMYTSDMNGIRIKLPKDPFERYKINPNDFMGTSCENKVFGEDMTSLIPLNEFINNEGWMMMPGI